MNIANSTHHRPPQFFLMPSVTSSPECLALLEVALQGIQVILKLATPAKEGAEEGAKTPWQERLPNLHVVRLDDWLVYGDKVLTCTNYVYECVYDYDYDLWE